MDNTDLKAFGTINAGISFDDDNFPDVTDAHEPVLDIENDIATLMLDRPF